MMRRTAFGITALLSIPFLCAALDGYKWSGQGIVNRPDSQYDAQTTVAHDSGGRIVAVWTTNDPGVGMSWACWTGTGWTAETPMMPLPPEVSNRTRPSIQFDRPGVGWLVWCNGNDDNSSDIASSRLTDTGWTQEQQVNAPDSTDVDWAPHIACGGTDVWCVWYGGPTSSSPYVVYASRWSDSAGCWGPEMQVSPQNNAQNWFCDVAVDASGGPHVVWLATLQYAIYYSRFDGTAWTAPQLVNDTFRVKAATWGAPRVICDETGVLHVSFTGVANGAESRDIFYSRNDGTGWSDCQMVTYDSAYSEWYSDIAVDRPDNVWIAYDRQGEGTDRFRVYAQHFDGHEWSKQDRLDNDSAYYDGCASVCLNSSGLPLVTWTGMPYSRANSDIYCGRYTADASVVDWPTVAADACRFLVPTVCSRGLITFTSRTAVHAVIAAELVDGVGRRWTSTRVEAGGSCQTSLPARLRAGVYFLHVREGVWTEVHKVIVVGGN
jgi:hypothetical protein